jgi:pseudomonalisin
MRRHSVATFLAIVSSVLFSVVPHASAQPADRIRTAIDDTRTVPLPGNHHPLARMEYDLGPAAPETRLERMILVLNSDAAQQQALAALLDAQHDPHSPFYRQWLTPESFAERFGVSPNDIGRIVSWLGAQGFSIDEIPAGGRTIVFSGAAAQVEAAFHTPIHRYLVHGEMHLANAGDPRIPEALAGVVAGVATLHDFRRQPMHSLMQPAPQFSYGGGYYYLAPGDFATIYDVVSLYASGINGAGQTIAIVARCNIPMSDVQTFRQNFGLPANNPTIVVNGTDPGIISGDELTEADLDVQWSGAVAPQATVDFVVSASTNSTDGVDLSAQYIVSNNLAPVMSTSFGSCEQYMGSDLTFYSNLWQQAAAQGITALISSGDSGAAGCDSGGESQATGGLGVNGLCSSPYSVCVGGTEFNEGSNPGQYWLSGNASNWSSALGYIPEMVWNDSGSNGGSGLWAGGGGASAYYSKPTWQSAPGVPADGQRDVPDVSLAASLHDGYLLIFEGGLYYVGGTSAASPSFAGLMALVNQQTGARQGNANTSFYALAALQGVGGLSYFHDIVVGNNSVPGLTGFNAVPGYDQASGLGSVDAAILVNHWDDAAGSPGLTLTANPASIAVPAGAAQAVVVQVKVVNGFNAAVALSATGLPAGVTAAFASPTLTAPGSGSSTLTVTVASSVASGVYSFQIVATGGAVSQPLPVSLTVSTPVGCNLAATPASIAVDTGAAASTEVSCGSVQNGFKSSLKLTVTGAPQGVTASFFPASILPGTAKSKLTLTATASAPLGVVALTVTGTGGGSAPTLILPLTIVPAPTFTLSLPQTSMTVLQGARSQTTLIVAHVGAFDSAIALSVTGMPAGVTGSFSPSSLPAPGDGTGTLTIQASATAAAGTYKLTIKGVGGGQTKTLTLPVTIQLLPAFTFSVAQKTLAVAQGATAAVDVTVSKLVGGFNSPVALSLTATNGGNLPTGLNPSFTPTAVGSPGSGTSILAFAPDGTSTPGQYPLTITASGASVTRTAALTVIVKPPPSFTLRAAAQALSVLVGGQASTQITSTAINGFSSTAALSGGTLPAGVLVAFAPPAIPGVNGKSTVNVETTSSAVPGSYTIPVNATGGGVTASVNITLNVGQLVVTPASAAITVKHGGNVSVSVDTSVTGTYSSSVTLSVTGLPKGVTASFSPATISNAAAGASTLKLTAASSATIGAATITIKAVSDGLTQTVPLSLTVQ